jgi:hypothetical protein
MNSSKLVSGFCTLVALTLSPISALAGEPFYFLTHDGQHALILGTVVRVDRDSIQFQPHIVISGRQIHSLIKIRHPNSATESGNLKPALNAGDRAIVSIDPEGNRYKLALGASKVSSLNPSTLKVFEGDLLFDQVLAFQWYVNSCGQEKDFMGDGLTLSVRHSDGTSLAIAKKHKKIGWIPLRKADFYGEACNRLLLTNQAFSIFP